MHNRQAVRNRRQPYCCFVVSNRMHMWLTSAKAGCDTAAGWGAAGRGRTGDVVGVEAAAVAQQHLLEHGQRALEVHVVPHALGLPAEDGGVRAEARLKLLLRQQVHPQHLAHTMQWRSTMRPRKPCCATDHAMLGISPEGREHIAFSHSAGTQHTWSFGSDSWRQRTRMSIASRQPNAWLPLADLSPLAPSFGTRSGWLARRWLSCRLRSLHHVTDYSTGSHHPH